MLILWAESLVLGETLSIILPAVLSLTTNPLSCETEEKRREHATAADAPPVHYWYDTCIRKHSLIAAPLSELRLWVCTLVTDILFEIAPFIHNPALNLWWSAGLFALSTNSLKSLGENIFLKFWSNFLSSTCPVVWQMGFYKVQVFHVVSQLMRSRKLQAKFYFN